MSITTASPDSAPIRLAAVRVVLTLAVSMVLLTGTVRPAGAQEWVYTARSGDNLWVLAKEYLLSMRYWGKFRAMNYIPNPKHLQPGTRIKFPINWLRIRPAPAVLVRFQGSARMLVSGSTTPAPAIAGTKLNPGDRIITGADGSAVLRFADGSVMLVRPESDISMNGLGAYGRSGMVDSRARLHSGRVETRVKTGGGTINRLEISTPSASAVVRGTRFRVASAIDPPITRTEVVEGRVRVANEAGSVRLKAGTGTIVRPGQPPVRPTRLLPPPDLNGIAERFERLRLRIGWPEVTNAVDYRAQVAVTGTEPALLWLDVAVSNPQVELPELPDGHYVLRVRALDEVGLEGLEASRAFELDARPEPPATVEPRPDQTVRKIRPRLRWTEPAGAVAYRLQVARSAQFANPLIDREVRDATSLDLDIDLARGAYHWRLATIDASAEQGPFGDAQAFLVRPTPAAPEAQATTSEEDGVFIRWQAGLPGQTYEVQLADDQDFSQAVRSETTARPDLVLPALDRDVWFRVRTVDTDGYQGPYGTPQRIEGPREQPWWLLILPFIILAL